MKASIRLDLDHHVGEIDPRIFSGFLEHLGRAVYEGIFDPESPLSDANGFRIDVAAALRKLAMPYIRYPGGNFVSNYDWRDGVGPQDERPVRPDFAWKSIEPNTFGVDEFIRWCRWMDTEPMMAVNLGTLGPREAAELVEYCNLPGGTHWSNARRENGSVDPHGVKLWCLGNEMDGPWQAGHCSAADYAVKAQQAARLMRGIDPAIELVACGSSGRRMNTYMEWDRVVLETCWEDVEYISAHRYSRNTEDDSAWFLAEGVEIDRILNDYAGLLAYVRGVKKSEKRISVAFDEWNVWYKDREIDGSWTHAPHLIEEVYNLEDALVCAQFLNSFHAARQYGENRVHCADRQRHSAHSDKAGRPAHPKHLLSTAALFTARAGHFPYTDHRESHLRGRSQRGSSDVGRLCELRCCKGFR